jgi:hypothetical protein
LNLLGSSSSSGLMFGDFVLDNDTIYGITPNKYIRCDTVFNILSSATSTAGTQTAICKKGNTIGVMSGVASHDYNYLAYYGDQYVALDVFDKLTGNSFKEDLSMETFEFVNPTISNSSINVTAKIKLKNKGQSMIASFQLNCYLYPSIDGCNLYYFKQDFNDLQLYPGDSIVMFSSPIYKPNWYSEYYCVFVTMPNGEGDKNSSNNMLCDTLKIVGITENYPDDNSVRLYPNPFSNNIQLESEVLVNSIEVVNTLGETVSNKQIDNKRAKVPLEELSSGLYFVKINAKEGQIIKKIIKN